MFQREKPRLRKRWVLAAAATVAGVLYVVGFGFFLMRVAEHPSEAKSADAIVTLTGGDVRLPAAMRLLTESRGRRLLISGVHEDVTREELHAEIGGSETLFKCCVDLGRSANNTIENASEIAAWARDGGYRSIIVVTAAYHLPRSLMEIQMQIPGLRLNAHPVFPRELDARNWWSDRQTAWVLIGEYTKFLLARVRLSAIEALGIRDLGGRGDAPKFDMGTAVRGKEPQSDVQSTD
jgi:uncharacterized SAM-binding protein YcdF (DUF218 family)